MVWNELICKRNCNGQNLMLKCQIWMTDICWTSFFNLFAPNAQRKENQVADLH